MNRRTLAPLLAILTAGCLGELGPGLADSDLTVESPADGAYVGSRDVRVSGASLTETVRVNGTEVPVVDGRWATTVRASGDGSLQIEVHALTDTVERSVVVDSIPPELVLTAPSGPAFIDGDTLVIQGRVFDESPTTVTADGEPVSLGPDGSFEISRVVAPGAHRVRLHVSDRAGHAFHRPVAAIVGELAPYESPVEDAAALTVGADGFTEINVGLNDILSSDGFRQQLRDELIGGYGDISIRQVEFSSAEIELGPNDGGVTAHALIHGVHVGARACFDVLVGDICKSASVRVETLEVSADVGVSALDGQLVTETRGADVTAHGFSYNVSGVPGFIEGLFRGRIRDEIEGQGRDGITDVLNSELPRMLQDASLDAGVDVLGTQVAFLGTFREVALDPTGMHVRLDLDAWSEAPFEDRMSYGYLRLPHAGLTRPDVAGVSAQVSLEALNAVTFATWSGFGGYDAGVLPGLNGDLTVSELALATQSRRSLGELAPADAPVAGALDLGLPPVVTMDGPDGALRITAADARVHLAARMSDGAAETDVSLVTLSVFLSAPITLSTDPTGALVIELGELTIAADALEAPEGFVGGEELDAILQDLSPQLTAGLLELGGLELPSLAGFELDAPAVSVTDNRIRVDATLTYAGGGSLGI